jgi:hypothetical protein
LAYRYSCIFLDAGGKHDARLSKDGRTLDVVAHEEQAPMWACRKA